MAPTAAIQRKLADLTRLPETRKSGRTGAWKTTRDGKIIGDAASKLGYLLETEVFRPLSAPERTWLAESTTMVSLEALAFRGLPARLATLLLREADIYGTIDGYSHQELAERLGTYRETVSQLLGRFRGEGLVSVEPRRIRLLDCTGLEAYAES